MKIMLVPTDYSETATNATQYALELANHLGFSRVILYNAYQQPNVADPISGAVTFFDLDTYRKISEDGMEQFSAKFSSYNTDKLRIETMSEFNDLSNGIDELCERTGTTLIVMGITGGGKVDEVLIGSNTISVARNTVTPVVIVPAECKFNPIKEVVLACDFKKIVETTPVAPIKQLLDTTKAKLFVLNVDHNNKQFTADTPFQSLMLDTLLQGYNPEYHFIDSPDYTEAINHFAEEKEVDLIITIPKKQGWFDGLFRRSRTNMLAFHTHVPLMVIHE